MSKQKTIWIDMTDFSIWKGHLTGVQRLVYQIAVRYEAQPGVRYFIFDGRKNVFFETSFVAIKEKIEASERAFEAGDQQPAERSLKEYAFMAYRKSPQWFKDRMTPARKSQVKALYKRSTSIASRSRHPKSVVSHNPEPLRFTADDLLLIMGKAWDEVTFGDTVRKLKLEQNFKLVQVVYDLIPTKFPQLFGDALFAPYTQHMFEVAANSDGLLPISESTKRDMQQFCKDMLVPAPPMNVVRLGDDFSTVKPRKPGIESLKTGNFLLCVGTIEVRKNHQLLYTAYKEGLRRGVKLPKLVIVGGKGWYSGDVLYEFMRDPELRDLVYIAHEINDHELHWLYENCKFTVYPSVYEGWGLPVAESLAYGKLCLSSDTSSMPEIAGDLIDYFSPYDPVGFLEAIEKYLDPKTLQDKEVEIAKKYRPTTWDTTFAQVQKLVASVHDK